ncbi:hypothetical protein IQ272_32490 [Chroococcidiopsidales cyanobacterium LEGE 13417]|nr:hypothetical protein [Chroococcidiopsidales cyanobacterium LEGE 13417]
MPSTLQHLKVLELIYVLDRLRDTLNAYPDNMEAAIQAVLEYAEILKQKHQNFQDQYHVTNCESKSIARGWKPH